MARGLGSRMVGSRAAGMAANAGIAGADLARTGVPRARRALSAGAGRVKGFAQSERGKRVRSAVDWAATGVGAYSVADAAANGLPGR